MTSVPRPQALQSPAVRIVNAAATRWRKVISLDPAFLMEKARRRAGLKDFGDDDFLRLLQLGPLLFGGGVVVV